MEPLILSFALSFTTPTNNFLAYYPTSPSFPSWEVSSNICNTASMAFAAPTGQYEIYWNQVYPPTTNNPSFKIDYLITHAGGTNSINFPVLPDNTGFFFLKQSYTIDFTTNNIYSWMIQ